MNSKFRVALLAVTVLGGAISVVYAAGEPMVGGSPMYPTKNVVENASTAKNLTTLVAAVKEAGLVDTLSGPGPFTVFAPDNAAFDKLPKATVEGLMKPDKKADLKKILTYHVVAGKITSADLMKEIKAHDGSDKLTTVEGETLTAKMAGDKIELVDEKGGTAMITQPDVLQSNGVAHIIDSVLMPK